ncbi:MAG TPA: ParB/RepB/Spo0J family partition protein [Candidatus Fournierella excrementavium]|uniref:ParB/RepB/Spo0J family partition protein n=1 Tax=Candidatus Allofournierella excrementavium TaxID=2838591 RepID=UPI001F895CB0|nr:ParB/RepB/Spo0J family partition protein [Oscillospiraceae bacterium]HJD17085.1 ParB/RepB/Spo0J family partition protein [Candidatus Fournierella excrementavium]
MAVKKGGLGRGLESLFEDAARDVGGPVSTLPLREIEPDKDQPRKDFDEQALSELADSIARHGLLQPIAVRAAAGGAYKIIAGERRWRAARLAGLSEVPVVIKDVTDAEAMELALIENLQREDLDPVEEAMGYRQLMERCELTQEQTAQKIGKSRSAIANSLRLLNLPDDVLAFLKEGKLSTGHAKVLLGLPDAALQTKAAEAVVGQNLNVRQTEALCKKLVKPEKPPKPQPLRPALAGEVEYALREVLGSEVKVDYKNGQGSLTVHFYSDEQLSAFANLLGGYNKEENK